MPQLAGSGNRSSTSCANGGAPIGRSPHPSVTAPAAVAAVVRKVRREIGVIENSWRRMVCTVLGRLLAPHHRSVRLEFPFRHGKKCCGVATGGGARQKLGGVDILPQWCRHSTPYE